MRRRTACCVATSILTAFIAMSLARGDEPRGQGQEPIPKPVWHRLPADVCSWLWDRLQVPERRTPYVLDRNAFAQELASAKDETERLGLLARRWDLVTLAVAHCSVAMEPVSFHRSLSYWQGGYSGAKKITSEQNLEKPVIAKKEAAVFVHGDCLADITVKAGALIHVYGDLRAKITVIGGAQCEIVIGGDIKQKAGIDSDGIVWIFIGGSVDGYMRNRGSSKTWINGDLNGKIGTGTPIASVHVMGDFNGSMKPLGKGALAYVDVRGFMSSAAIKAIADQGYTQFQATVGLSDQAAGLYPKRRGPPEQLWVIHVQRQPSRGEP